MQKRILEIHQEIVRRYGHHPSFGGISLSIHDGSWTSLSGGDADTYVYALSGLALVVAAIAAPEGLTGVVRAGRTRLGRGPARPAVAVEVAP